MNGLNSIEIQKWIDIMFWVNGRRQTAHSCKNQLLNASSNIRCWEMIIAVHLQSTPTALPELWSESGGIRWIWCVVFLLKMEKSSVNLPFQTDSGHYRNSFSVPASHLPGDIRWWLVTGDDMLTSPVTSGVGQCWGPAEETDLRRGHGATPAIRGVRNDARTPATRLPDIRQPGELILRHLI